jgi:hypothetical protein
MTAAQKTAKANFKKAIEYRKKTGCTLKQAFAHVYGKKVGAVKKKAAPKKKAVKKKFIRKPSRIDDLLLLDVIKSKTKKAVKKQTGTSVKYYDKLHQAKPVGKRTTKNPHKYRGKTIRKSTTYTESRANRSDKGRLLGIKQYNWEQLDNITLTRINNDVNGNPRYVTHFLNFLNKDEQSFLPFAKKYDYALKKAKLIGGRKFHNKQYGGGIVFQSYNTDNLKEEIIDVMESTPKIKY